MTTKEQILERLAECRAEYSSISNREALVLLENTMSALQDLLHTEKIDWEKKKK